MAGILRTASTAVQQVVGGSCGKGASGTLSQDWYAWVYGLQSLRGGRHGRVPLPTPPGIFYKYIRQGVLLLGVAPLQNVLHGLTLVQSLERSSRC